MDIDLTARPRLADLQRLGGPAEAESGRIEAAIESALEAKSKKPRVTPPAVFAGREGYNTAFIGRLSVPPPKPVGRMRADVLPVEHSADSRLDYQHFSVVLSKSRRMAMFVAVNIDGQKSKKLAREHDVWALDGRVPIEAQIGEELYFDNDLDRGHLVRREDPNWGNLDEAEIANQDTFHFTNCSPQMAAFNQRTWLGLAFVNEQGRPSATAYMIDQKRELKNLEATFGVYKTYQRSIRQIEELTDLDFGELSSFDGFSNEERATRTRVESVLHSLADIRV